MDDGSQRRILFYKYPHKFVDAITYNDNSIEDKTNLRLKNVELQNIF